ncbi:hypothetical protein [Streptomyces sp. NPDC001153]
MSASKPYGDTVPRTVPTITYCQPRRSVRSSEDTRSASAARSSSRSASGDPSLRRSASRSAGTARQDTPRSTQACPKS